MFVAIAKIIWAFDIFPANDTQGKVIEPDISHETGYEGGIIVTPKPFLCDLRSRSEKRKETILREFAEAKKNIFPKYKLSTCG